MPEVGEANTLAAAATVPDELDAARALNNEYLKLHSDALLSAPQVTRAARLAAAIALVALPLLLATWARADDSGWVVNTFDAQIQIQNDGRVLVTETLAVDFGLLEKHGILRDIPTKYEWTKDPHKVRVYELQVLSVTNAQRKAWNYETSSQGANLQIKIGDADHTLSGRQTYVISYLVKGALNSFSDHDELYWNVTGGDWGVPISRSSAAVRAPGALTRTDCFVGATGANARCLIQGADAGGALFTAPRALIPGEQLTVVAWLRKGMVPEPLPILQDRARELSEFFDTTPLWLALAAAVAVGGVAFVYWRWYTLGRDEREHETIVPEYEPPERLLPAQIGLLVDERADTLDVTATIVDLAVRGFLTITEIPKQGLFGSRDWKIVRTEPPGVPKVLQEYEQTILNGLFSVAGGTDNEVKLSELRRHFYVTLGLAEKQLYGEAVKRGWFPADPATVRATYAVAGVIFLVLAGLIAAALGFVAGGGLVGIAAAAPAVALLALSPVMPRKTKAGAELMRRSLGFRQYMQVAEKDRQKFAEKEHIFAAYLPFAIVFRCVDQWAKAFEGIDLKAATSSWYVGNNIGAFSAMNISRDLSGFSEQISTAIASTPGGSGSSGFGGGGGAGGGGGGGGGGSW
ncbi:MAG TPA: DUF2207 domain-containing protein [Candidatus Limnocylindria bacterium]